MTVAKERTPVAIALLRMPVAAMTLAFLVSSAMWPDASKPVNVPAVKRNERIQFQPGGAPVPLSKNR